jgi:hypothetical protein
MTARRRKLPRCTKITILIVGEGLTEKAFLQHIKELYVNREADVVVKVECGSGGAPKSVVQKTIRLRACRAYDKCFVLVDADRPLEVNKTLKKRMHTKPPIEVLKATPCIEGLLLAILQYPKFSQHRTSSDNCKREFETKYISANRKTDPRSYAAKFSRKVLDDHRKAIPELETILKAMQV